MEVVSPAAGTSFYSYNGGFMRSSPQKQHHFLQNSVCENLWRHKVNGPQKDYKFRIQKGRGAHDVQEISSACQFLKRQSQWP